MKNQLRGKLLSKRNQALIVAAQKGYTVISGNPESANGIVKTELIKGRPTFNVRMDDGSISKVQVSRLVGFMKYGILIFGFGVCVYHKDGNKLNNNLDNIMIGSRSDAQMSKSEYVRKSSDKKASSIIKKYNHDQVIEMYKSGKKYKQIMEETGIKSKSTISFIINNSLSSKI